MKRIILLITSIISVILAALIFIYPVLITAYLTSKYTSETKLHSASAIGIIGGADGPTSIFVSKDKAPPMLRYSVAALFAIISITSAILSYKLKKKEKINE